MLLSTAGFINLRASGWIEPLRAVVGAACMGWMNRKGGAGGPLLSESSMSGFTAGPWR